MVILIGESLGKRQRDLNEQVHRVVTQKEDFEKIKLEPTLTDADVLFKIDVAAKYKNIGYILDILKSGDGLYISRALKCAWLCDDEFSNVINVDYLHHNIFPFTSFKMKRKMLTTISMYLKNKDRCESFYKYCIGIKLQYIALKFLIFTSEYFKIEVIKKSFDILEYITEQELFFKNFVGNSFTLATAIMQVASGHRRTVILYYLRYLISVSENDYLDLLEKYDNHDAVYNRFGLRISTTVLVKHRSRLIKHPLLYVKRLNKNVITKYISAEDAKIIACHLLPAAIKKFWDSNFCNEYDFILKKIPADDKFQFVKKIFTEKYPNEEFEMSRRFFDLRYFELMTVDEREAWALRHIETNTEIQGVGRNYRWYEYVSFEKAFPNIKKYIMITPNLKERHDVVEVLVESVRNLKHMKTLLEYYYERHVNEALCNKTKFVNAIINKHDVFEFDNDCWSVLNKLLHNMNVYKADVTYGSYKLFKYVVVVYHILHNIDLPETLKEYILKNNMLSWYTSIIDKKLSKDKLEQVNQYINKVYVDEITTLLSVKCKKDNDEIIRSYVDVYVSFLYECKKTASDCPDVIMEFIKADWHYFQHLPLLRKEVKQDDLTEAALIRQLKKDSKLVVENISAVKDKLSERHLPFKIQNFLRKLRIYFPNDVTKEYLNFFMENLTEKENSVNICTVVDGIFQLADNQTKVNLMIKYAPTEAKIQHGKIDERLLQIQEGICRFVCFTRPPVPLSNVLKYITGDYVRFCLPMFQSYQANLPPPLLQEFVTKLIDAPVSIQKHALRLVFECFSIENLTKTIYDSWKRTKNISLRYVLYQSLCNKIRNETENKQSELFELLKKFTAELRDDDNVDIYKTYMHDMNILPEKYRREYIMTCWQAVSKFPDKTENFRIKNIVIVNITRSLDLLDGNAVKQIVEDHVKQMLVDKNIRPHYENEDLNELYQAKWKLVVAYIIFFSGDINLSQKNIDFVRFIAKKCVEMLYETYDDIFIFRKFFVKFIDDLIASDMYKRCEDTIPIFETILSVLGDSCGLPEIYRTFWSLKLTILQRKQTVKVKYDSNENSNLEELVKVAIYDYGVQVAKLVRENVDSKNYCVLMTNAVGDMIKKYAYGIRRVKVDGKLNSFFVSVEDVEVLAAEGLTEVPSVEPYLLAINILPMESNHVGYGKILNKLKVFDSLEVQTCWIHKFVCNDFKRRRLN